MKKIFTLIVALVGLTSVASAANVDDIQPLKHSYVFVADDYTGNGTVARTGGSLFGDDHFLDVKGGSIATNKGSVDLSVADTLGIVTDYYVTNYGDNGSHLNSLRLKNAQNVIAFKASAGSKIIIFYQNNGVDRYPLFAKDAGMSNTYSDGTIVHGVKNDAGKYVPNIARIEWTVPSEADNVVTYVGSKGGDMFVSYIIVEANETAGTPRMKVGAQSYENGLYYKDVTITAVNVDENTPTYVKYTTDGTDPATSATAQAYTAPIRIYAPSTVKAQAFYDEDGNVPVENADNESGVSFKFNAPTIDDDGNGNVTITSEYAGATNYVTTSDGSHDADATSSFTLTESAKVTAYSEIKNGTYATFESNPTSKDVYVLSPITATKTIAIHNGDAEVDEENTTAEATAYKFSDPSKLADKAQFYFNNTPQVGIVSDAQYQIDGDSVYLKMANSDNLTFKVADGDSVTVTVVTSKNSCKDITDATYKNTGNYVNVDGTTYGFANDSTSMADNGFQNVITFGLTGGTHTFKKYSGTGNILVHSITITPASATPAASDVYDFAAAAEAQEAISWNLNPTKTRAPFRRNNNGSDRQERNFRGYEGYTGSNLPAVCNVYFKTSFTWDSTATSATKGVLCANESYVAIDSLTDNAVITIEYVNANGSKLVYAPSPAIQTTAAVNGVECVTGETEVESGTAVTITKAVSGGNVGENVAAYTVFKIPAGTTVTKVTVAPGDGNSTVATGIKEISAAENATIKPVKVIENGRLVIKTANGTFSVAGARIK